MTTDLPHVEIYTDGGCDPNPGPGGWAAILIFPKTGDEKELSGGNPNTTNNQMELTAAIEALKALKKPCQVDLYTDSEYLKNGITSWIENWKAKSWQRGKHEVKNIDLWKRLDEVRQQHEIAWHWVKGHAGNTYNERADKLATAAIPRIEQQIDTDVTRIYLKIAGENPSLGAFGWAASIIRGDTIENISGGHPHISVNHFSLFAVLEVLKQIPDSEAIQFFTNNSYLYDGISKWVKGWSANGWQKDIKFKAEWRTLDKINRERQIKWILVKGEPTEEIENLKELAEIAKKDAKSRPIPPSLDNENQTKPMF